MKDVNLGSFLRILVEALHFQKVAGEAPMARWREYCTDNEVLLKELVRFVRSQEFVWTTTSPTLLPSFDAETVRRRIVRACDVLERLIAGQEVYHGEVDALIRVIRMGMFILQDLEEFTIASPADRTECRR